MLKQFLGYTIIYFYHYSMLDVRTGSWCHSLIARNNQNNLQSLKTFSVSPCGHKVAVAFSGGSISLMDTRTGKVLAITIQQYSDIAKVNNINYIYKIILVGMVGRSSVCLSVHRPSSQCLGHSFRD